MDYLEARMVSAKTNGHYSMRVGVRRFYPVLWNGNTFYKYVVYILAKHKIQPGFYRNSNKFYTFSFFLF